MTLVVAQRKKGIISAVSDTGITEHDAPLSLEKNVPKICIITPDLAVGFAGSPELL
jgi:20S proteasome alpha/beta subunit